jgi:hypothetical protein
MKIIMTKRKPGIYSQAYMVMGLDSKGIETTFLIGFEHAKNYAQAVRFWKKTWGNKCKAFYLKNTEPLGDSLSKVC